MRRAPDHARVPHRRLHYEAYDGFERDCLKFCDCFLPKLDEYEQLLTTNRIWMRRTKASAFCPEDCIALGVTGPVLRARA